MTTATDPLQNAFEKINGILVESLFGYRLFESKGTISGLVNTFNGKLFQNCEFSGAQQFLIEIKTFYRCSLKIEAS